MGEGGRSRTALTPPAPGLHRLDGNPVAGSRADEFSGKGQRLIYIELKREEPKFLSRAHFQVPPPLVFAPHSLRRTTGS
ncbi:hypothetical protein CDAR_189051 [Caerostris darwini]|uniref:Uncharacterized protein n=1 Tax=Caerostris darwini TaxID=1538125 RepID=A0AAV4SNQ2_9ARAC|nr:hypothetical protein CDAR_189051 [Caerostris darwini]